MEKSKLASVVSGFVDTNYELIKRVELISFAVFIIGFLLYKLEVTDSGAILTIGIMATSLILFLQAFKTIGFDNSSSGNLLGSFAFISFMFRLYYYGLSVAVISLLAFYLQFKNGNSLASIGGISLLLVLFLSFFIRIQDKSKIFDLRFYLRIVICFIFMGFFMAEKGIIKL